MTRKLQDPLDLGTGVHPTDIFPQGHLSGVDADTIDGKHADELVSAGSGDMQKATYDPNDVSEQLVGLTATQTLSNKTLDNPQVSGDINTSTYENYKINGSLTNEVVGTDLTLTQALQVPFPIVWHDVLVFGNYSPTYETSADGTTWSSSTVDLRLFSHIENQTVLVINPTTTKAVRWMWSNTEYNSASWFVLAFTYKLPWANITVLCESSSDGTTWTQVHSSSFSIISRPFWIYTDVNQAKYFRLTITHNSGDQVWMSSIRWLTNRWSSQGLGKELSSPISWDENKNVSFKNDTLPVYPNNYAALAGGLTVGEFNRTGGDPDLVCVVH